MKPSNGFLATMATASINSYNIWARLKRLLSMNRFRASFLSLSTAFVVLLGSCSINNSFTVTGDIEGIPNGDSVLLLIIPRNDVPSATSFFADTMVTTATGGQFTFKGEVEDVGDARLVFKKTGQRPESITLFLEAGEIHVAGKIEEPDQMQVTGTPNNDDLTVHRISEQKLYADLRPIQEALRDSSLTEDKQKQLQQRVSEIRESIRQNRIAFIQNKPNSYAAPLYLRLLEDNLELDSLTQLYSNLGPAIKATPYARGTSDKIAARKRTQIGQPAPSFSSVNQAGDSVHFHDFKGKYVLIEFWASWCVPCRAENPNLLKAFQEFQPLGFEILGVSMDTDKVKWVTAIEADHLSWTNVSELKGFGDPIAQLYGVQPIPDNFLVDPDGIIIARKLRGTQLAEMLASLLPDKES